MHPSRKYVMIDVNGDVRMIDARLVRAAGPFIGPALAVAEIPAVERALLRLENAYFQARDKVRELAARIPRSKKEALEALNSLAFHFKGRPVEKPALMAALILCLFSAELTVMAVHRYLQVPEYPEPAIESAAESEPTMLDIALAGEIESVYSAGMGRKPLRAKLVTPLPAFVEQSRCYEMNPPALLRIRWPAVKLPVSASVRRAVVAGTVRMPVDRHAFHPLDKESILRAERERLGPVLAMVAAVEPDPGDKKISGKKIARKAVDDTRSMHKDPAPSPHNGRLSALFESGDKGVYAIGYDPKGGTSYGKYQLSSRMGTLDRFIEFLERRAPAWAVKLRRAGNANTGYRGGPMARQWKSIAAENPSRFEYLQDLFVHETYYVPVIREVRNRTGVDFSRKHGALREVLWSTAVQHGPSGGADIFVRAAEKAGRRDDGSFNKALVEEIFRERELKLRRQPRQVLPGLKRRLKQEKSMAMTMLTKPELPYLVYKNL